MVPPTHRAGHPLIDVALDLQEREQAMVDRARARLMADESRQRRRLARLLAGPPCYGPYPAHRVKESPS